MQLEARLNEYQRLYSNLVTNYEQVRLAEAQTSTNVVVSEPAIIPSEPISPKTTQNILLSIAAIIGDTVNDWIGWYVGPKIFYKEHVRFLNKEYLKRTHEFYERHGGKTIILARFIPIIRTLREALTSWSGVSYSASNWNPLSSMAEWMPFLIRPAAASVGEPLTRTMLPFLPGRWARNGRVKSFSWAAITPHRKRMKWEW